MKLNMKRLHIINILVGRLLTSKEKGQYNILIWWLIEEYKFAVNGIDL